MRRKVSQAFLNASHRKKFENHWLKVIHKMPCLRQNATICLKINLQRLETEFSKKALKSLLSYAINWKHRRYSRFGVGLLKPFYIDQIKSDFNVKKTGTSLPIEFITNLPSEKK